MTVFLITARTLAGLLKISHIPVGHHPYDGLIVVALQYKLALCNANIKIQYGVCYHANRLS